MLIGPRPRARRRARARATPAMKSSWEAESLFPNRRRFGRVGGFSVNVKSLGGFWVRSPSGPSTLATPEPTTSSQIRSARRSAPTGHHEREICTKDEDDKDGEPGISRAKALVSQAADAPGAWLEIRLLAELGF
jgi:hypothetical protein